MNSFIRNINRCFCSPYTGLMYILCIYQTVSKCIPPNIENWIKQFQCLVNDSRPILRWMPIYCIKGLDWQSPYSMIKCPYIVSRGAWLTVALFYDKMPIYCTKGVELTVALFYDKMHIYCIKGGWIDSRPILWWMSIACVKGGWIDSRPILW